jgi:hypothetical protein
LGVCVCVGVWLCVWVCVWVCVCVCVCVWVCVCVCVCVCEPFGIGFCTLQLASKVLEDVLYLPPNASKTSSVVLNSEITLHCGRELREKVRSMILVCCLFVWCL